MKVTEIMTKNPVLLKPDYSISEVAKIFANHRMDGAPVVDDNGVLIGIFSQHNIFLFLVKGLDKNITIDSLMDKDNLACVHPDDDISEMLNYPLAQIFTVVDSNHKVLGVITRDDLLGYLWKTSEEMNSDLTYLLNFSYDGLSIVDANENILYRNCAMKKLTGVPDEEAIGYNVRDLHKRGAYGRGEYVSSIQLCQETKKPVTVTYKNYEGRWVVDTCSPVLEADGSIRRIICNIRDVTEFNLLKEELKKANKIAEKYETTLHEQYKRRVKPVYSSQKMQELIDYVSKIAVVDSTVLITGESGTGKELVAENIHYLSNRKDGPLIKVNCSSIPESLFESEMFGYESGAFTGAKKSGKLGYFDMAENGSIFLDEIGDLPYSFQIKLLRAIQNKEYVRVGGNRYLKANIRIIAATNRDLLQLIKEKRFREDLYYRLNVIPVKIPPLRERIEDIGTLINYFTEHLNNKYNLNKHFSEESISLLTQYNWPGNVRELQNLVEYLLVTCPEKTITIDHLPKHVLFITDTPQASSVVELETKPLKVVMENFEKQVIEKAYSRYRKTKEVAYRLDVDISTIMRKVHKYRININRYKDIN